MTRDDILDSAKSIINGERQGTYGKAENSFAVIAQMWTAYLGKDLTSADVANMMILMKVARNSSGVYKDDNWIDICGYAALGGEIQSKYDNFGEYMNEPVSDKVSTLKEDLNDWFNEECSILEIKEEEFLELLSKVIFNDKKENE